MGKRLNEQISSAYIQAANKLNGQEKRKRIVVYVCLLYTSDAADE